MVAFHRGGNAVDAAIAANAAIAVTCTPPLRYGWRPVRPRAHRTVGRRPQRQRTSGLRRRPCRAPSVGTLRDAVPSRHPLGHACPAASTAGSRCTSGSARSRSPTSWHRRSGSPNTGSRPARCSSPRWARSTTPPAPISTRSPVRRRTSGPSYAGPASAGHCGRSPPAAATASTAASSAPACWTLGAWLLRGQGPRRSQADWVEPLTVDAFGVELHTIPPNSQGYLTLGGAAVWRASSAFPTTPTTRNGRTS